MLQGLNVTVSAGSKVFTRPLRIAPGNVLCVARKGAAVAITPTGPSTAIADLSAPRIAQDTTRVARLADIGVATKAQTKAAAVAAETPTELETRYRKLGLTRGIKFLANMSLRAGPAKKVVIDKVIAELSGKPAAKAKGGKAAKAQAAADMAKAQALLAAMPESLRRLLKLA